jgi:hypothetical protein
MFKRKSSIELGFSIGDPPKFMNDLNLTSTNYSLRVAYKYYFGKDLLNIRGNNMWVEKFLEQDIPRSFYISPNLFYCNYSNNRISNNNIVLSLGLGYQNNLRMVLLPNITYKADFGYGISYHNIFSTSYYLNIGAGLLF